jgi:hypothetical protein
LIKQSPHLAILQIFNFSYWNGGEIGISSYGFFDRFYKLFMVSDLNIKLYFINASILFALILVFLKSIYFHNKKIIFLSAIVLASLIMTIHIPSIFRLQVYNFSIFILITYVLHFLYPKFHIKYIFLIFNILFFLSFSFNTSFKDPSGENIDLNKFNREYYMGYLFDDNVIRKYESLNKSLKNKNFANMTADPLIEKIFPKSKLHSGLPFYSIDFHSKINNNKQLFFYEYTLQNNIINNTCSLVLENTDLPFIGRKKYFLCQNEQP